VKQTKKEKIESKIKFLEQLGDKYSKQLRKNATKWELSLYNILKELHYKFIFQHPIVVNNTKNPQLFILDFLLTDYNLIIEVNSIQYHTSKADVKNDNKRAKLLKKEGFTILTLFNKQISTFSKEAIGKIIQTRVVNKF